MSPWGVLEYFFTHPNNLDTFWALFEKVQKIDFFWVISGGGGGRPLIFGISGRGRPLKCILVLVMYQAGKNAHFRPFLTLDRLTKTLLP